MEKGSYPAIVQVNAEEEQNRGNQVVGGSIHNHYYGPGPVNHIGHAHNANFGANNGFMSQHTYQNVYPLHLAGLTPQHIGPLGPDLISLLNPILDASHTRNMKRSPPNSRCLPGTRTSVISRIRAWADSEPLDANPHMLWTFGYAGCGKSAVAHEIAKQFAREGRLAACFVFFRGSGDRSTTARFATTVASQLAAAVPETKAVIASTVTNSPWLLKTDTASLSDQFEHLVYRPIDAISSQHRAPLLIVLDGVDECQDGDDVAEFIESMIEWFNEHPRTLLRVLIASRVEDRLHRVLHSATQVQLLDLVDLTSDSDIAAALDAAIDKEKCGQVLSRDASWPFAFERAKLVKHIGGSFIFMATIVKVLFDRNSRDGLTPVERLPLVLSMKADFDELYKEILQPWQHLPHFQAIISVIALAFRPLSVAELADILKMKPAHVVNVLINLHAIMQVPGDDHTPVTLWHTSLRDFLCSQDRSGIFFASPTYHRLLAYCDTTLPPPANTSSYARRHCVDHLLPFLDTLRSDHERGSVLGLLNGPILQNGQTALEIACRKEAWKVVHALVKANIDVKVSFRKRCIGTEHGISLAAGYGEWDTVFLLLERGADPNVRALSGGAPPSTQLTDIRAGIEGTPLAFAIRRRDLEIVSRLLAGGADPNLDGWNESFLQLTISHNEGCDMVNLLLDHGADPNMQSTLNAPRHHHNRRTNNHSHDDFHEVAQVLLTRGADPNIQSATKRYKQTPLHVAIRRGSCKVMKCLLDWKADTSIIDIDGETALQMARYTPSESVIEELALRGMTVE